MQARTIVTRWRAVDSDATSRQSIADAALRPARKYYKLTRPGRGSAWRAMGSAAGYGAMVPMLAAAALAARKVANASAKRGGEEVQFEETAADKVVVLGLEG